MVSGSSSPLSGRVLLRDVEERDLPIFFEDQRNPVAHEMAAFTPRERDAFMAHWAKLLADDTVIKKAIVFNDQVAGHIGCFERFGKWLVGYWLSQHMWGKGIATRALSEFVAGVEARPLDAHVAKHNIASRRVLEKCGFTLSGEDNAPDRAGGKVVEEFIYTLLG